MTGVISNLWSGHGGPWGGCHRGRCGHRDARGSRFLTHGNGCRVTLVGKRYTTLYRLTIRGTLAGWSTTTSYSFTIYLLVRGVLMFVKMGRDGSSLPLCSTSCVRLPHHRGYRSCSTGTNGRVTSICFYRGRRSCGRCRGSGHETYITNWSTGPGQGGPIRGGQRCGLSFIGFIFGGVGIMEGKGCRTGLRGL